MAEAFALRADYAGTIQSLDVDDRGNEVEVEVEKFRGASFALRNGETFDIAEKLAEGDGVIVTEDTELTEQLRATHYLKSVPVPDGHPTVTPLSEQSMRALRDMPEVQSITGAGGMKKDELIARIQRARAGQDPNVSMVERDGEFVEADETGEPRTGITTTEGGQTVTTPAEGAQS